MWGGGGSGVGAMGGGLLGFTEPLLPERLAGVGIEVRGFIARRADVGGGAYCGGAYWVGGAFCGRGLSWGLIVGGGAYCRGGGISKNRISRRMCKSRKQFL